MIRRVITVLPGGALIAGSPAAVAYADCSGPTATYSPLAVDRGDNVTVTGHSFGASCYDTGPPPAGEGVLGRPLTGIEITFVQGAAEVLVAMGDADADYGFVIDVEVPATFEPGPLGVVVRTPIGVAFDQTATPVEVSDAPVDAADVVVVAFGPAADDGPVAELDDQGEVVITAAPGSVATSVEHISASEGRSWSTTLGVVVAAIALATIVAGLVARQRRGAG